MAITHAQVWAALDTLAARLRLSPSGLAKTAGLDPTSFNRSKRHSKNNPPRPRWPSTESLAKVLNATGVSLADFATLAEPRSRRTASAGFAEDGRMQTLDARFAVAGGWDDVELSGRAGETVGLAVTSRSGEPVLRAGDQILVELAGAGLATGERAVLRPVFGEPVAGVIVELTAATVTVRPFGGGADVALPTSDLAWCGRIMAVSLAR